mgnify:FL=1
MRGSDRVVFHICAPAGEYRGFDHVVDMATILIGDTEISDALALSLKEQFSDIRDHQYHLNMTKPIYLSIEITNRDVIATLIDCGKPWRQDGWLHEPDAQQKLLELLEANAEHGRGKYICAILTHSLEYRNGGRVRILAWTRK